MPGPREHSDTGGDDGRNELLDRGLPGVLVPRHHRVAGQVRVGVPGPRAPVLDAVGRRKLLAASTSKPEDWAPVISTAWLEKHINLAILYCMPNTNIQIPTYLPIVSVAVTICCLARSTSSHSSTPSWIGRAGHQAPPLKS